MILALLLACAADPSQDEIDALRREVAALRAEVEKTDAADVHTDASNPNLVAYGDEVHVARGDTVDEVTSYGEDVVVDGHVLGDATSFGGDLIVRSGGVVEGDAVTFGGGITVEAGGEIHGDRIAYADADIDPEAPTGMAAVAASLYHRLVFLLSFAGAGVLVVGLVPQRVGRIAETVETRPVRSFVLGLVSTLVLTVAAMLFAITFVGLPVSFLIVAGLGLAWLMGFVGLCQALGDRMPFEQKHHGRWIAFLVASIAITFVGVLPWVGWVVLLGGSAVGVGAAMTSRLGGRV